MQAIWSEVVGEQLEELLWALVEEMGTTDMMWRALGQPTASMQPMAVAT